VPKFLVLGPQTAFWSGSAPKTEHLMGTAT